MHFRVWSIDLAAEEFSLISRVWFFYPLHDHQYCKTTLQICSRLIIHNVVSEGDHDSGVDESTQQPKQAAAAAAAKGPHSPVKTRSRAAKAPVKPAAQRSQSVPKPFSTFGTPPGGEKEKKVPMNKVKVGMSNSPNLKQVRSKIGSMNNATHKPGGGAVKIENRKLDWKSGGRTQARNEHYTPKGGEKKVSVFAFAWEQPDNNSFQLGYRRSRFYRHIAYTVTYPN